MDKLVFNVFAADYHLIASFTDMIACKNWLMKPEGVHEPAWVGVFPANEMARAVPMWTPGEFIDDFPHK